jgi:hypothetical protein
MKNNQTQEVIPGASRLIKSLRDLGYDFSTAIADIIDNSIEANATEIQIDVDFFGESSCVRVKDNGKGMTHEEIIEAMRFGSEKDYEADSLGKFGLGLKTSSLSQCRKLTVASRDSKQHNFEAFSWDIDHIEKTNKWEIITPDKRTVDYFIDNYFEDRTGTIIIWQKLDRLLDYKDPNGEAARKKLNNLCRELETHIAMVFHRFLSGEIKNNPVSITLNCNRISPWDPFARNEDKTKVFPKTVLPIEYEGVKGEVLIEPFRLPQRDDFRTMDEFRRASGPQNWNQQQGFYIYRSNRMIQSGGWSGMRTADEHTKLARIAVSFTPNLDNAFKINVAKMRVQLPMQLKEEIDILLKPVIKDAQDIYRRSQFKPHPIPPKTIPNTNSTTMAGPIEQKGSSIPSSTSHGKSEDKSTNGDELELIKWTLEEIQSKLLVISNPDEKKTIDSVFLRLREIMRSKG